MVGALRNIVSMLTKEFLRTSELQNLRDKLVLRNFLKANLVLQNYAFTDRLLRGLSSIDSNHENLLRDIINNFDKGAQNTVTLIPQLIIGNKSMPEFGKIDRNQFLEICQAAERYFRKKLADSQTEIKRKIMLLEGKSAVEIDDEIKRSRNESSSSQLTSSSSQSDSEKQNSYSFVNIVFNYFNDSSQDHSSGANGEEISKLKQKAEKLKSDQIEHMKWMNKMFTDLANAETAQQQFKTDEPAQQSNFVGYLQQELLSILKKILAVFKDSLHAIVQTRDGLYCLLFISNCIRVL